MIGNENGDCAAAEIRRRIATEGRVAAHDRLKVAEAAARFGQ